MKNLYKIFIFSVVIIFYWTSLSEFLIRPYLPIFKQLLSLIILLISLKISFSKAPLLPSPSFKALKYVNIYCFLASTVLLAWSLSDISIPTVAALSGYLALNSPIPLAICIVSVLSYRQLYSSRIKTVALILSCVSVLALILQQNGLLFLSSSGREGYEFWLQHASEYGQDQLFNIRSGGFYGPNTLAIYPFISFLILFSSHTCSSAFIFVYFLLSLALFQSTLSMNALLLSSLVILLAFLVYRRSIAAVKSPLFYLLPILILLSTLLFDIQGYLSGQISVQRFIYMIGDNFSAQSTRLNLFNYTLSRIYEFDLFQFLAGAGLGYGSLRFSSTVTEAIPLHGESSVLKTLFGTGIIGLSIYFAPLCTATYLYLKNKSLVEASFRLSLFLSYIISFFIVNIIVPHSGANVVSVSFSIALACIVITIDSLYPIRSLDGLPPDRALIVDL